MWDTSTTYISRNTSAGKKKRPLDCLPPGGILKIVDSLNSKRRYEEWSITFLSRSDFSEKAYPPSCLRLTKNLPNIVPLADKIDTNKDHWPCASASFTEAAAIYCDQY